MRKANLVEVGIFDKGVSESRKSETPDTFVQRIVVSWQKSVRSIIDVGQILSEAKRALPHGQFTSMINTDLPFGPRMAQMLMEIARHPVLTDPKLISYLPASWSALYAMARLPTETLPSLFREGRLGPDSRVPDIKKIGKRLDEPEGSQETKRPNDAASKEPNGVEDSEDPYQANFEKISQLLTLLLALMKRWPEPDEVPDPVLGDPADWPDMSKTKLLRRWLKMLDERVAAESLALQSE